MNRVEFERLRRPSWESLSEALTLLEKEKFWKRGETTEDVLNDVPKLFREVCQDLALARHRMYGSRICDELNDLVMRSYKALHKRQSSQSEKVLKYIFTTVPQAVRANAGLFWACTLSFLVPYLAIWGSSFYEIAWVQSLLGSDGMLSMEQMYGKEETASFLREEFGSNFMMFAYYINNNVSIDFRIFAGGIFFGVGSLFFLLFNGLYIGAAAGYVHYACDPEKFYTFVVGHSSVELIGMVLAGMAGMKLGLALLRPGRLTRGAAVAEAGREAMPLILGGALMTVVAAVIEGFWSAQTMAPVVKYSFGAMSWALTVAYLLFSGRRFRGA